MNDFMNQEKKEIKIEKRREKNRIIERNRNTEGTRRE